MIVRPVLCRPFIGRRDELAYLRERRLEAGSSHGELVLISGDAGVGKSRLIAEFCSSLAYSRWRIGNGTCLEVARRPYGPILDVLARIDVAPFELGAVATQREQFDAIVDRLASIASRTAVVVVVEDLHWADAATLDFLAYLGSKLDHMRLLVLASFRPDDLHPTHPATPAIAKIARSARAGRIDLVPLRGIELRTFIDEALAGFALPDDTRRAIALAGEGNPFFTEELLKGAVERKATHPSGSGRRDLPPTVRATLLERLRPFDDAERRIVAQAAVIGRTFSIELLAATLEVIPADLLPALQRARDFQLVEEVTPTMFRFRHGLTREAIYGDFLGAELPPLHRAIGLALANVPDEERVLEALAYHWWAAGDVAQAARYNELAGDAAVAVYAHEDAIAFYKRVLELPGVDAMTCGSITEKIANLRIVQESTQDGLATYLAAADMFRAAGAHEREAVCRVRAAMTAYTLDLTDTTAPLEEMLTRLHAAEYLARSRVHVGLAWLTEVLGATSRAERHLALVDARAFAAATDIAVRFYNVAASVAATLGDVARLQREHAAWLEAARAHGPGALAGAHYNGAKFLASVGLHDEALHHIDQALHVARRTQSRHAEECAHATAAMCYLLCGDLDRARAAVEAVPTTTDNRVNVAFATACGTLVGTYLDDEALIEKWFDGFEATIAPAPEVECGAGFAEIMVRRGRNLDAAALIHRALPDCERLRGHVFTLLAAGRYGSAVDRGRAREHLVRAAAGQTELLERPALALFDAEACVRDGRSEEAITLARDAADGFRRLRAPLLEAAALELAGNIEAALILFRRCGATHDVRRLEGAAAVGNSGPSQEISERLSVLSAREREIAVLAADGRSNLEIARTLSITQKTVEKHLASVYQKLRISSRTQLGEYTIATRAQSR